MTYQVYKDSRGEWRWRLIADNGRILADSAESYQSKEDGLRDIELVKRSANAPVAGPHGSGDPP